MEDVQKVLVKCQMFVVREPFFVYPCSSFNLGISVVSCLNEEMLSIPLSDVAEKIVLLPRSNSNEFVAIPL